MGVQRFLQPYGVHRSHVLHPHRESSREQENQRSLLASPKDRTTSQCHQSRVDEYSGRKQD